MARSRTRRVFIISTVLALFLVAVVPTYAAYSVSQTLNYGVSCTETVTDRGSTIINSSIYEQSEHSITCNRAVEMITVNGWLWKDGYKDSRSYRWGTGYCYNTSVCYLTISSPAPNGSTMGLWHTKTSGFVGTPSNNKYYGIMQDLFWDFYIPCEC